MKGENAFGHLNDGYFMLKKCNAYCILQIMIKHCWSNK